MEAIETPNVIDLTQGELYPLRSSNRTISLFFFSIFPSSYCNYPTTELGKYAIYMQSSNLTTQGINPDRFRANILHRSSYLVPG